VASSSSVTVTTRAKTILGIEATVVHSFEPAVEAG
jgi:hypothetical protein